VSTALALMESELGGENCRDILAVLEGLSRLVHRGVIGADLHDAFIETLGDELAIQKIANDIVAGLLPTAGQSADTARSEDACNESKSD
jgi:hypothetical protein